MAAEVCESVADIYDAPRGEPVFRDPNLLLKLRPWYHGTMKRTESEALVRLKGDFLVRDSISKPGDYVLTVFWNGSALHFQINRQTAHVDERIYGSSRRSQYHFEAEQFDSIPDLIEFYRTHQKAVTLVSKCLLLNPVPNSNANRCLAENPSTLRKEIEANYANAFTCRSNVLPPLPNRGLKNLTIPSSMSMVNRPLPKVPSMAALPLSQRVILNEASRRLQRKCSSESRLSDATAPAKPSRAPSLKRGNRPTVIVRDISDGGFREVSPEATSDYDDFTDYCEMDYDSMEGLGEDYADVDYADLASDEPVEPTSQPSAEMEDGMAPPLPSRARDSASDRDSACVADFSVYDSPRLRQRNAPSSSSTETSSQLDEFSSISSAKRLLNVEAHSSAILPATHKPLDRSIFDKIQSNLLKTTPQEFADIITAEDVRLLLSNFCAPETDLTTLVALLLPGEATLRGDVLDRCRCFAYFVTASILLCKTVAQQCDVLEFWLSVARKLFETENFFGFANVFSGLRCEQIKKHPSVQLLRQRSPVLWRAFDSELPESMQKLENAELSSNSCKVPNIQSVLRLFASSSQVTPCVMDLGIETVFRHLSEARKWSAMSAEKSSQSSHFTSKDALLCELAESEFHLKFLFGSRGALVSDENRFAKLEKLLTLIGDSC